MAKRANYKLKNKLKQNKMKLRAAEKAASIKNREARRSYREERRPRAPHKMTARAKRLHRDHKRKIQHLRSDVSKLER